MFHTQSSPAQSPITVQQPQPKEKIVNHRSIAVVITSLFAVVLFSACAGQRIVVDLSTVYAASAEIADLPELADRDALAVYTTLSPGFAPADRVEAVQPDFLADRQALAEYQATLPHLVFVNPAPMQQVIPLMLNDRQDVAEYQFFISHSYGQ